MSPRKVDGVTVFGFLEMKTYGSFVIRCWLIDDRLQDERSIFDVEHIQTGIRLRAESLTEVNEWMMAICKRGKSDLRPPRKEMQRTKAETE